MSKIWSGGASEQDGPDLSRLMTKEDNAVDQNLIEYEILGLMAYHLELSGSKVLPLQESKNILSALLKLKDSDLQMGIEFEDVHSLIQEKVNEITPSGGNLRLFLSRNDQSHFDIRSFYMDSLLSLSLKLVNISKIIEKTFGSEEGIMPGYTHYRQAMPMAIATYFDYLSSSFYELARGGYKLYEEFKKNCPFGYGSGYGTAVKVNLKSLSNRLGFEDYYVNPVFGASHRGLDEVEMASFENRIMLLISKLSQDFIMFSSDEFNFLKLPDGFTTGSSLMANKRNPDFLEMLEGYASDSIGALTSSISIVLNKGIGYHRDFQLSKDKVITSTLTLIEILKFLEELLATTKIDPKKSEGLIENSTNATMNAFELFSQGTQWREAYGVIGAKVRNGEKLKEFHPGTFKSYSLEFVALLSKNIENEMEFREMILRKLLEDAKQYCKTP